MPQQTNRMQKELTKNPPRIKKVMNYQTYFCSNGREMLPTDLKKNGPSKKEYAHVLITYSMYIFPED